jgi:hypothetical protein
METQWHMLTGMHGIARQGLMYASLEKVMTWLQVQQKDQPEMFRLVRVMELAALEELYRS